MIYFIIDLVAEMADWARDDVATADPLLLRFMTHLVLFFRSIGLNTNVRDVIFRTIFQHTPNTLCMFWACCLALMRTCAKTYI